MRKKTIDGVPVVFAEYRPVYGDGSVGEKLTLHFVKTGRRISVGTGDAGYWSETTSGYVMPMLVYNLLNWSAKFAADQANAALVPKLFAKLLREGGKTKHVSSGYSHNPRVEFTRDKRYVTFVAPCGEKGRFTVAEADKLADAIESL